MTRTGEKKNDEDESPKFEARDFPAQGLVAQRDMQRAMKNGKTCIDCHKGIAHKLPEGYESDSPVYEEDLEKL